MWEDGRRPCVTQPVFMLPWIILGSAEVFIATGIHGTAVLSAVTLGIQDSTVPSGSTSISQSPSAKPTVSPVCVRPEHKNEATTQQEWPT